MTPKEKLFLEHRDIARKQAAYFSWKYSKPFPEVLSDAEFGLTILIYEGSGWEEGNGASLGTWLFEKLKWWMTEVCLRGKIKNLDYKGDPASVEFPASDNFQAWGIKGEGPEKKSQTRLQKLFQEVGEEGEAIIKIFLDMPWDLWEEVRSKPGRTSQTQRANLSRWLIDTQDWDHGQVRRAFKEVEACL